MNHYESDNESAIHDLDMSWIHETKKLQEINHNYFKEPISEIEIFFIYINPNDYIDKISSEIYDLTITNNESILQNEVFIQLIDKHKFINTTKYKLLDVLLYNVDLSPDNIQFYSQNENLMESSSKFLEPLSILHDFVIPPSIFIFHKINSIFVILKELQSKIIETKPILKPAYMIISEPSNKPKKHTKKVKIQLHNSVQRMKPTRKNQSR
jgi:hypothetical protein|uniref:Uncharacterized protein n=1 Tax=viral metagenome TaxID=1070528 RepID=A0A6C0LQZ8_9ZZZZ